ncbi:hypothetical protein CDD83_884 [Cordyceps sp. RAO-2017]|nr:hypothetical protein CDD83_884 [Cordyceps sp. RAO-2017]
MAGAEASWLASQTLASTTRVMASHETATAARDDCGSHPRPWPRLACRGTSQRAKRFSGDAPPPRRRQPKVPRPPQSDIRARESVCSPGPGRQGTRAALREPLAAAAAAATAAAAAARAQLPRSGRPWSMLREAEAVSPEGDEPKLSLLRERRRRAPTRPPPPPPLPPLPPPPPPHTPPPDYTPKLSELRDHRLGGCLLLSEDLSPLNQPRPALTNSTHTHTHTHSHAHTLALTLTLTLTYTHLDVVALRLPSCLSW